jgi:hypothetical protein
MWNSYQHHPGWHSCYPVSLYPEQTYSGMAFPYMPVPLKNKDSQIETRGPIFKKGVPYVEQLNYNNPYNQKVFAVWHRGETFFVQEPYNKVYFKMKPDHIGKEYRFRYGSPDSPGPEVEGQLPVYDSVPGDIQYTSVREIVWVFVPAHYKANSLRSSVNIKQSGFPIEQTNEYLNHPVL